MDILSSVSKVMHLKHTVVQFFKGREHSVGSVLRQVAASRSGLQGLPK